MAGLFPGSGIGASLDKLCAARTQQAALETGPSVRALALAQSQHRQRRGDYPDPHRQIGRRNLL